VTENIFGDVFGCRQVFDVAMRVTPIRGAHRRRDTSRTIEAGQVWANTHGVLAINHMAPYGGVKQSGIGRKSGIEGILEYIQSQTITTYEHA
jgi:acyl-CoA reductase-like NAD-dependent aldehyde dehydrogenase